ncbi:hypothetical protein AB4Y85_18070 [Microvirga sp. 2YAF29]|uniref:hypothetical protein n=1 Tax=Microvirga sp. 2YAF29 TaxID=3233031 RepID=UPI003F945646
MAESTNISGPIEIKDSSAERVAFELMKFIRNAGVDRQDEILELYARCLITSKNPYLGLEKIKKSAKGG